MKVCLYIFCRGTVFAGIWELKSRKEAKSAVFIRIAEILFLCAGAVCLAGGFKTVFGLLAVILSAGLCTAEFGYWWENMRKLLFFNKAVNPFDYEYLLNFDFKNEVLKYRATLREGRFSGKMKWLFAAVCPLFCLLCRGMLCVSALLPLEKSLKFIFALRRYFYCAAGYVSMWVVNILAAKKFFYKKGKKG